METRAMSVCVLNQAVPLSKNHPPNHQKLAYQLNPMCPT